MGSDHSTPTVRMHWPPLLACPLLMQEWKEVLRLQGAEWRVRRVETGRVADLSDAEISHWLIEPGTRMHHHKYCGLTLWVFTIATHVQNRPYTPCMERSKAAHWSLPLPHTGQQSRSRVVQQCALRSSYGSRPKYLLDIGWLKLHTGEF